MVSTTEDSCSRRKYFFLKGRSCDYIKEVISKKATSRTVNQFTHYLLRLICTISFRARIWCNKCVEIAGSHPEN